MNDRFKFNAIVSSYYDIDTPEEYKEVEPQFYLKNVDVFCTQEIGIDYDALFEAVKEQSKNLTEKEIGQIMQHFEDNSNSIDCEFVTITPDKIIQCTGLKDKNNKLIYEGDTIKCYFMNDDTGMLDYDIMKVIFDTKAAAFGLIGLKTKNIEYFSNFEFNPKEYEVIGNTFENMELLNGR